MKAQFNFKRNIVSESWQNDPHFVHYLSELSSYGVEKLGKLRLCFFLKMQFQ